MAGERSGAKATAARSKRFGRVTALCAMLVMLFVALVGVGCGDAVDGTDGEGAPPVVVADTTFMADIVRNVAGDRLEVVSLVPSGADPHSFEPTPQDARLVAECEAVVINVTGLVPQLDDLVSAVDDSGVTVIEAAVGLATAPDDPHLWLDPVMVIGYVANIAEGLATLDPSGGDSYHSQAQDYEGQLRELDSWIAGRVSTLPPERRLLVTNHKSLSYFAQRYGFRIVGAVFPTVSGQGTPSARQVAGLVNEIKSSGAPAIFLETGSNADLANRVAEEAGAVVVTDLYIASLGDEASTYIEMMRRNVTLIVEALR
ncbi:MAG: zinc ABC transporter substrate-binding protein [Thermoleophilia bacterium]|nr:zinc ABC transporter substrate-binding protein [Thermoleophilia bacterium]